MTARAFSRRALAWEVALVEAGARRVGDITDGAFHSLSTVFCDAAQIGAVNWMGGHGAAALATVPSLTWR
eukprot:1494973-Pyramimonas_sp.AAC.1